MDWGALFWRAGLELLDSAPQILQMAWPLMALYAFIYFVKLSLRLLEQRRLARSGIDDIDRMDGRTFEKYLETLFSQLGYRVESTRYVGDFGADLVTHKDGTKRVIQAKRYRRKVGVSAIQEAVAAKGYYGCSSAMVVNNSTFTQQALDLAKANQVLLWDRAALLKAILSIREQSEGELAATSTPPNQVAVPQVVEPVPAILPVCAFCGDPVTEKVRAFCEARPERFQGQIYCFAHQRSTRSVAAPVRPGSPKDHLPAG